MLQIWERRRRIPSTTYNDPLDHIFTEFDEDGDGHLTSVEIANALKSRGVAATPEQVQEFIDGECCALHTGSSSRGKHIVHTAVTPCSTLGCFSNVFSWR